MEANYSEQIKAIQKCELEILSEIDRICVRHRIPYFAIGGTALGAIRHKGFIPWDDDIDIAMERNEYNRFLSYASKELGSSFFIQNIDSEPDSPFYFTKIRKNDTQFVECYLKEAGIHQGIFVDIFPFDHINNNRWIAALHYRICFFFYQLFLAKSLTTICSIRLPQYKRWKKDLRKLLHQLMIPISKRSLFNICDWWMQLNNSQSAEQIGHIVRRRLRIAKKDLYPLQRVPFEGETIPVPNHYDIYLKQQFGDYMELPPENKRYGHLPYYVSFDGKGSDLP